MNQTLDTIKKVGAALIVLILVGMMGITFSRQPISEITAILSGQTGPGEFQGKEIPRSLVNLAANQCKERYSRFGNIPDYLINNCIGNELKTLVALPSLGRKLGIAVSEESVQQSIMKAVENRYRSQQNVMDPDDRLDMRELYNRELQYNPVEVRKSLETTRRVYDALRDFPVSRSMKVARARAGDISLNLEYIQYSTADLLKNLEKEVRVEDQEIREAYEIDQKNKPEAERRPYEKERALIRNRLITEKKQTRLAALKEQLGQLKEGFGLDEVQKITGIAPETLTGVKLSQLKNIPVKGKAPIDLTEPDVLLKLSGGASFVAGPITTGDSTAYVKVTGLHGDSKPVAEAEVEDRAGEMGIYHGAYLLEILVNNEANRGGFKVYLQQKKNDS